MCDWALWFRFKCLHNTSSTEAAEWQFFLLCHSQEQTEWDAHPLIVRRISSLLLQSLKQQHPRIPVGKSNYKRKQNEFTLAQVYVNKSWDIHKHLRFAKAGAIIGCAMSSNTNSICSFCFYKHVVYCIRKRTVKNV